MYTYTTTKRPILRMEIRRYHTENVSKFMIRRNCMPVSPVRKSTWYGSHPSKIACKEAHIELDKFLSTRYRD